MLFITSGAVSALILLSNTVIFLGSSIASISKDRASSLTSDFILSIAVLLPIAAACNPAPPCAKLAPALAPTTRTRTLSIIEALSSITPPLAPFAACALFILCSSAPIRLNLFNSPGVNNSRALASCFLSIVNILLPDKP